MNKKLFIPIIILLFFRFNIVSSQNIVVQNILNEVRIDSLAQLVKQLSGQLPIIANGLNDTIKTRFSYSLGNEKAYKFMRNLLIQYGLKVDSFIFSPNGKNLFGIKTGYKYPDKRLMIGAHYDNAGSWAVAPGADDNASGTAAVLEAARIFSKYDFPYTIVFALWDEEEQGALGSKYYTSTIMGQPGTFMGYINLDMIGWDGNIDTVADIHVRSIANSMQLAERAQNCNLKYNVGLNLHIVNPGSPATDHYPFWENGLTAIGINEEYDKDFNPYWHTPADTLGHFNLDFYQRCTKLAYATLADCSLDTVSTLSIFEKPLPNNISIWPNPFHHQINIHLEQTNSNPLEVEIFNSAGGKCIELYLKSIDNNYLLSLPENLSNGLYYIKLSNENTFFIEKIIKH